MAHKLKISLNHTEPMVSRTVIVPEDFSFDDLHLVIQCVMNWENEHMYQFNTGTAYQGDTIGIPDPEHYTEFFKRRNKSYDSTETYLSEYFNGQKKKLTYVYDFGDDWIHTITRLTKPKDEVEQPKCIAGENVAPRENCGGLWGFYGLIEMSKKKRKSAEEKEHLECYGINKGVTYEDVYGFDIDVVNEKLEDMFINQ